MLNPQDVANAITILQYMDLSRFLYSEAIDLRDRASFEIIDGKLSTQNYISTGKYVSH